MIKHILKNIKDYLVSSQHFEILTYDLRKENFEEKRIDPQKTVEKYTSEYSLIDDGSMENIGFGIHHDNIDYIEVLLNKKII